MVLALHRQLDTPFRRWQSLATFLVACHRRAVLPCLAIGRGSSRKESADPNMPDAGYFSDCIT